MLGFYGFLRIREFNHLENLKTYNCKDMSYAFCCSTDTSGKWDTPELTLLDLSHFDISKVEEIDYFVKIISLQSLNISGFKFSSVRYLTTFISYCYSLTSLDMTGIDVSELRYLNCFIMSCTSLETINLDTFNPVHCWDMTSLFCYCSSLKNITFCEHFSPGELYPLLSEPEKGDVAPEGFPSALTKTVDGTTYVLGSYGKRVRISSWFNGCTALEEIDFANWE